jgi:hypothetical protein
VIEFRAEFFNLFNRANFGGFNITANSLTFGAVTSADAPRIIQFGLKYSF